MTEPRWRRYLRFWRRDPAADVDDELRFHFAQRVAEFEAGGLSPSDALAAARERFGDVDDVRRDLVAIDRTVARRLDTAAWIDAARQDLRYAVRSLRRQPGLVATVVGTLALAVGANGAVFTLLDPLFLRAPSGVVDPGSVHRVYNDLPHWPGTINGTQRRVWYLFGYPDYRVLRDALRGLATVAIDYTIDSTDVAHGRDGRLTSVAGVSYATADLLPMLGVRVDRGRAFTEAEDDVDTPANVAVVSDGFARRTFGTPDAALGEQILVRDVKYQIIGVAAAGFDGLGMSETSIWLPFSTAPKFGGDRKSWYVSGDTYIPLVARLAPGVSVRTIDARATVAYRRAWDPKAVGGQDAAILLGPLSFARGPLDRTREEQIAARIALVAALLLLVACANTANLMLARGIARRREIAIRLALGVSRRRLAAQVLVEAMLFAFAAGAVSLVVSQWAGGALRAELLPGVRWPHTPIGLEVLAFTLGVSIVAGVLTGFVPAVIAMRYGVMAALKSGARDGREHRGRLRAALVGLQAALSLVLLVGAALFARSLENLRAVDLGFDMSRLVVGALYFVDGKPHDDAATLLPDLARRIGAMPGVDGAVASYGGPMSSWTGVRLYRESGDSAHPLPTSYNSVAVEPRYFRVTGTRILAGRSLAESDRKGAAPVIVVSQSMAQAVWPGQSAIGQCLRPVAPARPCYTVVGVAEDIRERRTIDSHRDGEYYVPLGQFPLPRAANTLIARAGTMRPEVLAATMRRALRTTFPTAEVHANSMTQVLAPELAPWIVGARLIGALAGLALIVATLGVYGSIAFEVRQRTREIAVRIALGATPTNIVALLVRRGTLIVGAGVAVGGLAAIAGGKLVATMLYGVKPTDPASLIASAAVLLAAAAAASLVPALRARSVDPALVLRDE
jgi:putative ABC transport system permease protein